MKYNENNKPIVCMQTNSTCYKSGQRHTIQGILVHSTGANNPYISRYVQPSDDAQDRDVMLALLGVNKYHNDWNHIYHEAGLNAWIGKLADGTVATVQTMPYEFKPWGCGGGSRGSLNNGWIQFEICEDGLSDKAYFDKVYNEACEFIAYLCKMYGLDPKANVPYKGVSVPVLTCHNDAAKQGLACNHADINHWFPKFGKNMATMREDVANLLALDGNNANSGAEDKEPEVKPEVKPVVVPDATIVDDEEVIWNWLMYEINNPYGVAGLMGNLKAESNLRPNNMQNCYEAKLGFTDDTYTKAVDDGSYTNFIHDSVGYGLAQWTFWSRKNSLLTLAKTMNTSIADLKMQLQHLTNELRGSYKSVLDSLKVATSVQEASNVVLIHFEKPKDQSDAVKNKRAEYGMVYFNKFAKQEKEKELKAGKELKLVNCPCYSSSVGTTPYTYRTETMYLWGSEVVYGRVRITTKKEFVGVKGKVTCWIKLKRVLIC